MPPWQRQKDNNKLRWLWPRIANLFTHDCPRRSIDVMTLPAIKLIYTRVVWTSLGLRDRYVDEICTVVEENVYIGDLWTVHLFGRRASLVFYAAMASIRLRRIRWRFIRPLWQLSRNNLSLVCFMMRLLPRLAVLREKIMCMGLKCRRNSLFQQRKENTYFLCYLYGHSTNDFFTHNSFVVLDWCI